MPPFLDITTFASMFGTLNPAQTLVATSCLQVVSDWIAENAPSATTDSAQLVTFEVTRDEVLYGKYSALSSFTQQTLHSVRAGTLDRDQIEKWITDRQRRMLGISLLSSPTFSFPRNDFGPRRF